MYTIDERDKVIADVDVPQCDGGAPCPLVLADDSRVGVAYYVWESSKARNTDALHVAVVKFKRCHSLLFGGPNDEAISGHPLASRGIQPYGAYRIEDSSWIRSAERMNRVHPLHTARMFANYRHYIFVFHDSIFECIAEGFEVEQITGRRSDALDVLRNYVLAS
jgi:hypothetical protein